MSGRIRWVVAILGSAFAVLMPSSALASSTAPSPPALTVSADRTQGPPGTTVVLSGDGWSTAPTGAVWQQGGSTVALPNVNLNLQGTTLVGYAVVPDTALPGDGQIVLCTGGDCTAQPGSAVTFTVSAGASTIPRLTADPGSGQRETTVTLSGEGLGRGTPTGVGGTLYWWATKEDIGSYTVDASGRFTGQARIPLDAADGVGMIRICQSDFRAASFLCIWAPFTVLQPTPTPTPSQTPTPTSTPTTATTTTVPTSAAPTSAASPPSANGTPVVTLSSRPAAQTGVPFGWLVPALAAVAALAFLGAGFLAAREGRRKARRGTPGAPPPASPIWPVLSMPAEIVAGEPVFAQLRLQPDSGRLDPALRVDVQFAADQYSAPAGTRFPDLAAGAVLAEGMSVPLIPASVAAPTAVRLVAYVFQQGHLVGWAQATPTVLPAGSVPRQGSAPTSAVPLGTPDGTAPDLTLTVSRGLDPRYLVWGFASPHPVQLPTTEVRSDLAAADARTFANDEVLSLASTDQSLLSLHLRGVSRQIGGRIPAPAWAALTAVGNLAGAAGRRATVLLVSEETYVPWELAEVPAGLYRDQQALGLLGAQVVIGRWVPPDAADGLSPSYPHLPPPGTVPVTAIAAVVHEVAAPGAVELPNARHEGAHLASRYAAVVVPADVQDVADLLEARYVHGGQTLLPDVVHLAGHGHLDPDHPARSGFVLNAGAQRWEPLTPAMVRGSLLLPRTQPFVFFNACESGTPQHALDRFGGLVSAALKAGARGVVAPLWKVGDRIALQTAQDIYAAALDQGLGIGEALTRVRAGATAGREEIERGCLAYVFFGHPNLHLARATSSASGPPPAVGQVLTG